jgi:hypothetical protein
LLPQRQFATAWIKCIRSSITSAGLPPNSNGGCPRLGWSFRCHHARLALAGLKLARKPILSEPQCKPLLSNCTFDRGSLTPAYVKPFDLFVAGAKNVLPER